jgi:hypothetical protein
VKPIYWKSIAIGLAGILIIVALYLLSAYLADLEWQEHYRKSPGSGVLMVGVYSRILFFVDVLVALAIIGAVSAWASRRDIRSTRDAIIAAGLAGGVPVGLATVVLGAILVVAFINTPAEYRSNDSIFLPLYVMFLLYAFLGMAMSIVGGLIYRILAKRLSYHKI